MEFFYEKEKPLVLGMSALLYLDASSDVFLLPGMKRVRGYVLPPENAVQ